MSILPMEIGKAIIVIGIVAIMKIIMECRFYLG